MERDVQRLSTCLEEANRIIKSLNEQNHGSEASLPAVSSLPPYIPPNLNNNTNPNFSEVLTRTLGHARTMIQQSNKGGIFTRLKQSDRLRAGASSDSGAGPSKKITKISNKTKVSANDVKCLEYILIHCNDQDIQQNAIAITDEIIVLRGYVSLKTSANECTIRESLATEINKVYPMLIGSDIEFLKASRRKLTKPTMCNDFQYMHLKILIGQGSLYIKIKDTSAKNLKTLDDIDTEPETLKIPTSLAIVIDDDKSNSNDVNVVKNEPKDNLETIFTIPPFTSKINTNSDVEQSKEVDPFDTTSHILKYLTENNAVSPKEIILGIRKHVMTGMKSVDSGDIPTNFINIDRNNVLEGAMEEFRDIDDIKLCLEVSFYGELAADLGGPRKEFFRLFFKEVYDSYFKNGLRKILEDDYLNIGRILATALLHDGIVANFLPFDIVDKLFSDDKSELCINNLRQGFKEVGIWQIAKHFPVIVTIFKKQATVITRKRLTNLLQPTFSVQGSNAFQFENSVYSIFNSYIREVASGRRLNITLGHILQFITGCDVEPVIGFDPLPTLQFCPANNCGKWSFIPTAHTCSLILTLPRGSMEVNLPTTEELYEVYDHAFLNTYFGIV